MTNEIVTFDFVGAEVRTAGTADQPLFCLLDVCKVLGVENSSDTVKRLDQKGVDRIYLLTAGGRQELVFINEANLYRVIFTSRKSNAKVFQDWVVEEVLPSIRKTGKYETSVQPRQLPPVRDTIEYIKAQGDIERMPDGYLKELLRDHLVAELTHLQQKALPCGGDAPTSEYTTVLVRARELGYSAKDIGNGSSLGKFVAKQLEADFSERVGKYNVRHYRVSSDLDAAIAAYFS